MLLCRALPVHVLAHMPCDGCYDTDIMKKRRTQAAAWHCTPSLQLSAANTAASILLAVGTFFFQLMAICRALPVAVLAHMPRLMGAGPDEAPGIMRNMPWC